MFQNYHGVPNDFLLGSHFGYVKFPIEKSTTAYNFWINTIHNVDWQFQVDTSKSDETNNVKFSIYQINQSDPFHSIELDVGIVVKNLESSEYSIKLQSNYEFNQDNQKWIIEIPGFDKIIDWKQGFFDDKAAAKQFEISYNFVVKSKKLCDSVELIDLYHFDSTIHDVEVNVLGHTMFLSKKLIALQSDHLASLIETQNISASVLPPTCTFDVLYQFFQIIHGVDLRLLKTNIKQLLDLANTLKVPRVTEYCKTGMVATIGGMTTNEIIDLADENSFWDVVPRKLDHAKCLADLKAQNWELDSLEDDIIEKITRRLFELN